MTGEWILIIGTALLAGGLYVNHMREAANERREAWKRAHPVLPQPPRPDVYLDVLAQLARSPQDSDLEAMARELGMEFHAAYSAWRAKVSHPASAKGAVIGWMNESLEPFTQKLVEKEIGEAREGVIPPTLRYGTRRERFDEGE